MVRTLVLEPESGDVPARASALCRHGRGGYCVDDALPGEREAVDFIYQHAFDYALPYGREVAEEYAAWCVAESWHPGAVLLGGSHRTDFERFLAGRVDDVL